VAVLIRKGLIDKEEGAYFFEDSFFRRWIRDKAEGKLAGW
jgi:hypothetical protein